MRTASRVLGIVGGCLAIVFSLFIIFAGVMFIAVIPIIENSEFDSSIQPDNDFDDGFNFNNEEVDESTRFGGMIFLGLGSLIFTSGVLGLVGGILVKKRNVLSGIFMLIGGGICLIIIWAFLLGILLLLGGIFALVNESKTPATQPIVQ